jgi:hypothetical protein
MSRSLSASVWILAVAAALAGSACGRYGPPVRASEQAASTREASPPPDPSSAPAVDPGDPVAPDQEP